MDIEAMVRSIDGEIARLEKARALLTGHTVPLKRGFPHTTESAAVTSAGKETLAQKRWEARKARNLAEHTARWTNRER
jgi:hypothetical protein